MKSIYCLFTFICLGLIALNLPLFAEDEKLSPIVKQLIFNSDHIVTGSLGEYSTETKGHKTIFSGKVKIEDVISSDLKTGETITVNWESHELMNIHHEFYKGIQAVWLLQKKGDVYYANHPARLQSLEDFEKIYNEVNSYSTRVYCSENYFWQDQPKKVMLIFRNIESGNIKLPVMEIKDGVLLINEKVTFSLYPITSFNRDKTILSKDPAEPLEGKIKISPDVFRELKTDNEYRIWLDLNQLYAFKRAAYYSVALSIKGFPGQNISAFEIRNRMKIPDKFDFLEISKDRFASEQKKHTIQMLMEAVGEKTPEAAFEKLSALKYLRLSNMNIKDISPLGSFVQLEQLDLSDNKIQDLNPIRLFRNLNYLDLSNNQIKNLEIVGYLGGLNLLDLTKNEIGDISPLKNLMSLVFLYLGNNEIDDIEALENLRRMRILNLSNNEIEEVKSLSKLISLQELNLRQNHIQILDPLTYARNLILLDVRDNPVSYVEHFDSLIKKHQNDYGNVIELKLLHDAFKATDENKTEDKDKGELLPEMGKKANVEVKETAKEEKPETFRDQVARTTGIKIEHEKQKIGNVVEVLEKEGLVLIQFKKDELPNKDDSMTIYRKDDYIGTVKIIEVVKEQAVGKILPELNNDRKLSFAVGDLARIQN